MPSWTARVEVELAHIIVNIEQAKDLVFLASKEVDCSYRKKLKEENRKTGMANQSGLNPRVTFVDGSLRIEWRDYTPVKTKSGEWFALSKYIKKTGKYKYRNSVLTARSKPWLYSAVIDAEILFGRFRKAMSDLKRLEKSVWDISDALDIRSMLENEVCYIRGSKIK